MLPAEVMQAVGVFMSGALFVYAGRCEWLDARDQVALQIITCGVLLSLAGLGQMITALLRLAGA